MEDRPGHANTADGGTAWDMVKTCSCGFRVAVETDPEKAPSYLAGHIATTAYEAHLEDSR